MPSKTFTQGISGGTVGFSKALTRTADGSIDIEPTLNTAKALSSWVKTDADTAAGTLAGGHGWSSGKGDIYWTGGRRYDVDITIATNDVTADGGTGDDFPASADTSVVLAMHQQVNCTIDGDNLQLLGFALLSTTANSSTRGHIHAEDADGDVIADIDLDAEEPRVWDFGAGQLTNDDGFDNPFTGDIITTLYVTMSSTTETVTLAVTGLQDITP